MKKSVVTLLGGIGRLALAVSVLLAGVQYVSATTYTWTGGSTDFNRKQNYSPQATYNNTAQLQFTTTSGKSQPGLTADATIGQLQFTNSGWTLSGNTNTLTLDSDNNFGSVAIDWSGTGGLNTINADLDFNNTAQYINVGSNCSLNISGIISNDSVSITKTGGGTLTLSGANTYTGLTVVSQGTLAYGINSALSSGGVTVNGATAIFDLKNYTDTVGAVILTQGTIAATGATTGGILTGTSYTVASGLVSARLAGSGVTLTKTGAGTVILSGANTYTGATTISGGTLRLDGSLASGSTVGIGASGTLGGTGTANGTVTGVSGAHIAPGASIGQLTVGSLVISTGMVLNYEFGATNDYISVVNSGGLTINGGTFNLTTTSGGLFNTNGSYNLMGYTGTLGGAASNLSVNDASKKYTFAATGSQIQLTIADLNASWLTIPASVTLRQMIGGGDATPGTLTVSNTAGDAGGFTVSGGSTVALSLGGGTVGPNPNSAAFSHGWADRTSPGPRSGTITLHNTANTDEPNQAATVTGAVVDNRTLLVLSTMPLGRVMRNHTTSAATAALTSAAGHSVAADVTLQGGTFSTITGVTDGTLSLARLGAATFNGTTTSASADITGVFTAVGARNQTATFAGSTTGLFGAELPGQVLQPLAVTYTATVVDPRSVTLSGGTLVQNVLLNGAYNILATLVTSGSDNERTRVSVAIVSAADANGLYISGGTGTLFNGAASSGTRLLTGPAMASYGMRTGQLSLPVTGEGLGGEGSYSPVAVAYSLSVGEATADRSNSRNSFGAPLSAIVSAHSGTYAGLESKVVGVAGSGGGPGLGTVVRILNGGNSTGSDATVLMRWRTRTLGETATSEGGTPGLPAAPLPPWMRDISGGHTGLLSDIVDISGMAGTGTPGQTDLFVLQMDYTGALFYYAGQEDSLRRDGRIFLGYLNSEGQWVNAVEGNIGANTTAPSLLNVDGPFGGTLVLGSWGVDTGNHTAWAVLDHNSQFAVLPEPATAALMLAGAAAGMFLRRRKR
jgi:autotransporter-associated beta strand protein